MAHDVSDDDINEYLSQVRASGVLGKSERRIRLLEHLIRAQAGGEGETLKAYSIGLDVFDKPEDFDPSLDSIVRVEMGRLRAALATFEDSSFSDTSLQVDVPVGTYRPSLTMREGYEKTLVVQNKPSVRAGWRLAAPILILLLLGAGFLGWTVFGSVAEEEETVRIELRAFDGDPELSEQVKAALRRGLVRTAYLAVSSEGGRRAPDFILQGTIGEVEDDRRRINSELINAATDRVVWAQTLFVEDAPNVEDQITSALSNELRVRLFGASKEVLEGRDPKRLTPEQLFVMATWVPGPATNAVEWELERIELMELALEKDPNYGGAHSVMADKLAYLANVYPPSNRPDLLDKAAMHARRALELEPLNPDVMFNVAQSHWHSGRIDESRVSMQRVLDLDPGHDLARFLALVIPYTCDVPPDDVVARAIAFDESLTTDNPIRWLTLTWIAWLHAHQGDFRTALEAERRAAVIFEIPYTFMRHAMLLTRLGDPEAAAAIIRRQQVNWPDISPDHFAEVTVPRLCSEATAGTPFVDNYEALAAAMKNRL